MLKLNGEICNGKVTSRKVRILSTILTLPLGSAEHFHILIYCFGLY